MKVSYCSPDDPDFKRQNSNENQTWNVQTESGVILYPFEKLGQLLREFFEYQLDILGVREMRDTRLDENRQGLQQVVGLFGLAQKTSDNDEQLLLLSVVNSLSVSNIFSSTKPSTRPRIEQALNKCTRNEIDYMIYISH